MPKEKREEKSEKKREGKDIPGRLIAQILFKSTVVITFFKENLFFLVIQLR